MIGKLETIVEDTTYISLKANLNLDISQFPWANKKGATKDSSLDYFKQIDAKSILKLYEIYKIDFEMFGYSVSEYLWKLNQINLAVIVMNSWNKSLDIFG